MRLTADQLRHVAIAERTTSCVSFVCNIFVIISFLCYSAFNKPINRLIFYACWINLLCDVASGIARNGIEAGVDSKLCQFQGFLTQWSHMSNVYWELAMAINVYLVFYKRYDVQKLQRLEPYYMAFCYGFPLIPAVTYLIVKDKRRGHVYGEATTWCSIRATWNPLRFVTEYGPAWLCCLLMIGIYIAVGIKIFRTRRRLSRIRGRYYGSAYRHNIRVTHEFTMQSANETTTPSQISENAGGSVLPSDHDAVETGVHPLTNSRANVNNTALATFDAATMAYFRFAALYFLALFATWTPPSVSRTLSTINPNHQIYVVYMLHGMGLSSQGFWNTVIYVCTSWQACKAMYRDMRQKFRLRRPHRTETKHVKPTENDSTHETNRHERKGQVMAMFEYNNGIRDEETDGPFK